MRVHVSPAAPVAFLFGAVTAVWGLSAPAVAADGSRVLFSFQDERIAESSGLAASHRHRGVYWTHNDSDDGPYVYAVDSRGRTVATVTLRGVDPRDVEGISVTPSGQVYVGDIGDNLDGEWPEVWIYRFAEPEQLADTTVDVVRYRVQYADGPRNAEALMVHPRTGRVYIASKETADRAGLYAGPRELTPDGVNTFTRVDQVPWVTDGAFSPDGRHLALRGYLWASEYTWRDGKLGDRRRLPAPLRGQGEAVTYTADGRSLLFGSEGAGSDVWQFDLTEPEEGADGKGNAGGEGSDAETDGDRGKGGDSVDDRGGDTADDASGQRDTTSRVLLGVLATVGLVVVVLRLFRRRK